MESLNKLLEEMKAERGQVEATLGTNIASTVKQLQTEVRGGGRLARRAK